MQYLREILKENHLNEVYFGAQGFHITEETELDSIQTGYSRHPDGYGLSGSAPGDWQESWVVIGTDTEVGDPYFVDTSETKLPVYTAMQGSGNWEPELVSSSLKGFIKALEHLQNKGNQSDVLIDPDASIITDPKLLTGVKSYIEECTECSEFWGNFFDIYNEWLQEN